MSSFTPPPSPFTPEPDRYNFSVFPKRIILEYIGDPGERIYGFGILAEDGTLTQLQDEETLGSLPSTPYDVMKADGTLVSHEDYRDELSKE